MKLEVSYIIRDGYMNTIELIKAILGELKTLGLFIGWVWFVSLNNK